MSYAEQVKQDLLHIVSEMSSHPGDYSKHPDTDFSRNRKLNFSTLIHLMISLETGTVRDELLKYFSYDHSTVTNSAFYQQRAKLSEETLPFLFRSFNAHYPHVLYKKKYQLTDHPSPLPGTRWIRILISLRMEKRPTDITRFISFLFLISSPKDIQTALYSLSERKMNSGHYVHSLIITHLYQTVPRFLLQTVVSIP